MRVRERKVKCFITCKKGVAVRKNANTRGRKKDRESYISTHVNMFRTKEISMVFRYSSFSYKLYKCARHEETQLQEVKMCSVYKLLTSVDI